MAILRMIFSVFSTQVAKRKGYGGNCNKKKNTLRNEQCTSENLLYVLHYVHIKYVDAHPKFESK